MKTIEQKIEIIKHLPGCGWAIRSEARVAADLLKSETERHAQELWDIEERFQSEAWRHIEENWKPEELSCPALCFVCGWEGSWDEASQSGSDCPACPRCHAESTKLGGPAIVEGISRVAPTGVTDSEPPTAAVSKAPRQASWSVELNCDCPNCGEYVNLLDAPDFWDGRELDIPEHDTKHSDNLEVQCPGCGHDFKVCCEW